MKQDFFLLVLIAAVWAALAVLYATVPMLHMPGYSEVWGSGAVVFLALAVAVAAAWRNTRRIRQDPSSA